MVSFIPVASGAAVGAKMMRYPSIDPAGKKIAFSYQGDIWTADLDGTGARRITIHEAYESNPCWSPDGKYIAFSSNRYGNNDIYTIPAEGGAVRRLTWYSAGDEASDWSLSSGILFSTRRDFRQVEWDSEIYSVSPGGGTPERFFDAFGEEAVTSPDGRYTAFVRGACRIEREAYTGSANKQIWIYDSKNKSYIEATSSPAQDFCPRWYDDKTLYYLSSAPGSYNIHSVVIDEEGNASRPVQVTGFKDDGIRHFDISATGKVIIAEYQTGLYTIDTSGTGAKAIELNIGTDYRFDPVIHESFRADIDQYSISPNGKYSALAIHGEIFITENHKKKERTVNISRSPWRDIDPVWTSDTTVAFISDRGGNFDIYMVRSDDSGQTDIFKSLKHKTTRLTNTDLDESELTVSPDRKLISFIQGNGTLITASIENDRIINKVTLLDGWATPGNISWSPDSRYLAYYLEDLNFNPEIYIHPADNSTSGVNVSMHPRGDFNPVWSPDGSKLGFTSERNNRNSDIWFVWLKKSDWEKTTSDWEEEEEDGERALAPEAKKEKKNDGDDEDKKDVEPLRIDFDLIHERLVQVTSLPGDEGNIQISKDGKMFFFTAPGGSGEGNDLFSVKWDGKDLKQITQGAQKPVYLRMDDKKEYLYMLKSGKLARIKAKSDKVENVAFTANLQIDHDAEREQIFEEVWRTLGAYFYDPQFHGRSWNDLKKKYRPWAMEASTKHDFRDVVNIMLGQLNASHMGLYGGDRAETQTERTGLLGVEIRPEKEGVRVVRVIPDSPAGKTESTLAEGDLITSVDGAAVTKDINFYSLFINKGDEKVLLSVRDKKKKEREVVIRPVNSLRNELYNEWVRKNRKLTEELSGGRLGYLHIQAMGWESFERFEREFTAAGSGKEAIVIDVRYNGGGWTTDYLMAVLNVDQHAYTIPRGAAGSLEKDHIRFREYYPYAERLPFYPWMKPSIALCNESSYSNAEIFSHAYKTLHLGTLVGKPTFGAVISTGGKRLIDGSLIRIPFRAWYVKATDENMEIMPAVPDIIVENPPGNKGEGKDPQLERAVKELLNQIDR
ncbi:MAG: PD40 domain-containing protein [Candidatus Krumholzibacteriota bacterium]|nr:PD40 domain-containing protein [Candidatus Krumholzibacteriota bacterium]